MSEHILLLRRTGFPSWQVLQAVDVWNKELSKIPKRQQKSFIRGKVKPQYTSRLGNGLSKRRAAQKSEEPKNTVTKSLGVLYLFAMGGYFSLRSGLS